MAIIAGTTEGIFIGSEQVAPHSVNVLRRVNGSILAGTSDGVYHSVDAGSRGAGRSTWL